MARVFFMVFESAGPSGWIKALRNAGHKAIVAEPRWPGFFDLLKQQASPPDAFLAECSKLPSHVRESCNYLQGLKAYKGIPFLLFNVKPEDEEKTRAKVPTARILPGSDFLPALDALLRRPPASTPA